MRPAVVVFDVNETLSDLSPLAARFVEVGAPASLAALWFASADQQSHRDPAREAANRTRFALWDRQLVAPLRAFEHGGEGIRKLMLHPEGTHLITQTGAGRFTLWDVEREAESHFPVSADEVRSAAWAPDGKTLALGLGGGEVGLWRWPGRANATRRWSAACARMFETARARASASLSWAIT